MSQIGTNDQTRFIQNTPAVADVVNANFDTFKNAHNDTDSRVITLESNSNNYLNKTVSNTFPLVQKYKISTITNATNATPIVITSVAHGRSTGDVINSVNVGGNTAANGTFTITKLSNDTFSLDGSVGNGNYTSGGVFYLLPKDNEDIANKAYVTAQDEQYNNIVDFGSKSSGSIALTNRRFHKTVITGSNITLTPPASTGNADYSFLFFISTVSTSPFSFSGFSGWTNGYAPPINAGVEYCLKTYRNPRNGGWYLTLEGNGGI